MSIIVRKMEKADLEEALEVENSAVRGRNQYLRDTFDYYQSTKGELSVACLDGKVVGIGKMTVLFDGSAWLELLRVHQDYQKMGVGTALYHRFMEQVEQYQCPHVGLYTGIKNIGSYTLAKNFGLDQDCFYISYSAKPQSPDRLLPFQQLANLPEQAIEIAHLNINHTFYPVNEATLRGFLSQGYLYQYEDTLLVMGSRFQPVKALYIAYISGSHQQEALDYAFHIASLLGVQKVTYHRPADQELDASVLEKYGFEKDPGEDLVMSKNCF